MIFSLFTMVVRLSSRQSDSEERPFPPSILKFRVRGAPENEDCDSYKKSIGIFLDNSYSLNS
jgi:hypothetical protein